MKLPQGRLVRERVVADAGTILSTALDADLTGYARLESQDALLLDAEGVGVLTFEAGVPAAAYHTGTDSAGTDALADIAVTGPYRLELYELSADALADVHDTDSLCLPPDLPAERLAGEPTLAARTREATPDRLEASGTPAESADETGAVEAFLDDEETISSIQRRARERARDQAEEWGLEQ